MTIDSDFLDERITWHKNAIAAYEEAITALANGAQTYRLNTGQTDTSVTRAQLSQLRNMLDNLYSNLAGLCKRRDGGGYSVRPGF